MADNKNSQEKTTKKSFWQSHIDAYRQTNMSRRAYCREQDIDYSSFLYWSRRKENASPAKVIPVTLKESVPQASHPLLGTLKFNTGASLLIHDASVLTFLLERLA